MDRSKLPRSKGSKSHQPFPGSGDLIALAFGKTTRPPESESRSSSSSSKLSTSGCTRPSSSSSSSIPSTKSSGSSSSSSKSSGDKKRESASSPQSGPPKKVRLHGSSSSSSSSPIPSSSTTTTSTFPSVPSIKASSLGSSSSSFTSLKPVKSIKREQDDLEINPQDLTCDLFFSKIEKAEKSGSQNLQLLMLSALKRLRLQREKPELKLCSGLLSAAQAHPLWFQHPSIVAIVYLIISPKKTVGVDVKTKLLQNASPLPPLLICVLAHAYGNVQPWPTEFFQLWVEDACGDRIWVDRPQCKPFVDNIISSFDTVLPAASLLQPISEPAPLASGTSSPLGSLCDIDSGLMDDIIELCEPSSKNRVPAVSNRCASVSQLESTVLDHAREMINKKTPDIPKNVLRALASASGLPAVRMFSVAKLEPWIHNQKCSRQAQELLLHLCVNAKAEVDNDIVISITKLRLKTKPLIHFFANCVNFANMDSKFRPWYFCTTCRMAFRGRDDFANHRQTQHSKETNRPKKKIIICDPKQPGQPLGEDKLEAIVSGIYNDDSQFSLSAAAYQSLHHPPEQKKQVCANCSNTFLTTETFNAHLPLCNIETLDNLLAQPSPCNKSMPTCEVDQSDHDTGIYEKNQSEPGQNFGTHLDDLCRERRMCTELITRPTTITSNTQRNLRKRKITVPKIFSVDKAVNCDPPPPTDGQEYLRSTSMKKYNGPFFFYLAEEFVELRKLSAYSLKDQICSQVSTFKFSCETNCAIKYDGHGSIFVLGGQSGGLYGKATNDIQIYDLTTRKWRMGKNKMNPNPKMINARCEFEACVVNGYIYAIGGDQRLPGERWENLNCVERIPLRPIPEKEWKWEEVECLKYRRQNFGVAELKGKIYVVGGYAGSKMSNAAKATSSVESFDTTMERGGKKQKWLDEPGLTTSRVGPCVVASDEGLLFCIGGGTQFNEKTSERFNTIEIFNPTVKPLQWVPGPTMNRKRQFFSAFVHEKAIYAVGGEFGDQQTIEKYDLESCVWTMVNGTALDPKGNYWSVAFKS